MIGTEMIRACLWFFLATGLVRLFGAERHFEFSASKLGGVPEGWKPELAGGGRPGTWSIVEVEMPSALEPLSPQAKPLNRKPAVAQTSASPEDERFPMLIHTAERFGDFTFTTRFRIDGGTLEQIAGVVFRHQDEKNFYVVRASALGSNLRFYKFVDG